jgi:hypothetical protein
MAQGAHAPVASVECWKSGVGKQGATPIPMPELGVTLLTS